MNTKYKLFAVSLLAAFVLPAITFAQTNQTSDQLQAQINALMTQIQTLQQALGTATSGLSTQLGVGTGATTTATTPTPQSAASAWCYAFNANLGIGSKGADVSALQTALVSQGITVPVTGFYGSLTASAVTAFQVKYKSDVLTPSGLTAGTGYVGAGTRAKLNALYRCGTAMMPTPTPSPLPPSLPNPAPAPAPITTATSSAGTGFASSTSGSATLVASQAAIDSGKELTFTWHVMGAPGGTLYDFSISCGTGITYFDESRNQSFGCGDVNRYVPAAGSWTVRVNDANSYAVPVFGQLDFGGTAPIRTYVTIDPAFITGATSTTSGANIGRVKSLADNLGTVQFSASAVAPSALTTLTLTFTSNTLLNNTFFTNIKLIDAQGSDVVAQNLATTSGNCNSNTCSKTWNFSGSGGWVISQGASTNFTVRADDTQLVAQPGIAESLSAALTAFAFAPITNIASTTPAIVNSPIPVAAVSFGIGQ